MRNRLRLAIAAALLAATQLATAGIARVEVSDFSMSASGGAWWYWAPKDVDWLSPSAATSVGLDNPALADGTVGWHGYALDSSVVSGASFASAGITQAASGDLNGVTAAAQVVAEDGQSGWAFANVFEGQIMVGGGATLTISATLSELFADGDFAQANFYIELCSTDFVTDTCDAANYAEAFVDGSSDPFSGPKIITTSWTNPGDTAWAKLRIGLTASAATDAPVSVPEPASIAMLLTGLGLLGVSRRRRR